MLRGPVPCLVIVSQPTIWSSARVQGCSVAQAQRGLTWSELHLPCSVVSRTTLIVFRDHMVLGIKPWPHTYTVSPFILFLFPANLSMSQISFSFHKVSNTPKGWGPALPASNLNIVHFVLMCWMGNTHIFFRLTKWVQISQTNLSGPGRSATKGLLLEKMILGTWVQKNQFLLHQFKVLCLVEGNCEVLEMLSQHSQKATLWP